MMKVFACLAALTLSSSALAGTPDENKELLRKFFQLPGTEAANQAILTGKLPEFLADDIWGRVNPIGTFIGAEGTIEYLLGLGDSPVSGLKFAGVEYETLIAEGDYVYLRINETWNDARTGVKAETLALEGRFRFNDKNQIAAYDLNVLNFGQIGWKFATGEKDPNPAMFPLAKSGICLQIQAACTGKNKVYEDFGASTAYMDSIPMGDFNKLGANTVLCRGVHVKLAGFRPEYHCSHVSPAGGGKCVDTTYDQYFDFSLTEKPVSHPHPK